MQNPPTQEHNVDSNTVLPPEYCITCEKDINAGDIAGIGCSHGVFHAKGRCWGVHNTAFHYDDAVKHHSIKVHVRPLAKVIAAEIAHGSHYRSASYDPDLETLTLYFTREDDEGSWLMKPGNQHPVLAIVTDFEAASDKHLKSIPGLRYHGHP